jgi:hypothetical protein
MEPTHLQMQWWTEVFSYIDYLTVVYFSYGAQFKNVPFLAECKAERARKINSMQWGEGKSISASKIYELNRIQLFVYIVVVNATNQS